MEGVEGWVMGGQGERSNLLQPVAASSLRNVSIVGCAIIFKSKYRSPFQTVVMLSSRGLR